MGGGRGGLPDTKRGGGQSTSGSIYEKWVGGGGGQFASGRLRNVEGQFASCPLRKVGWGGGGNSLQVHYEKWGGGAIRFRSITKSGGGGGGQFASGSLRKVGGGGRQFASGPLRKVGGGRHFASGPLRNVGGGGGGGDVSSPIGVWVKAPEASQAGTRTT